MKVFLGIDVGSVSTNIAVLNEHGEVIDTLYIRTKGQPITAVQDGLRQIQYTSTWRSHNRERSIHERSHGRS